MSAGTRWGGAAAASLAVNALLVTAATLLTATTQPDREGTFLPVELVRLEEALDPPPVPAPPPPPRVEKPAPKPEAPPPPEPVVGTDETKPPEPVETPVAPPEEVYLPVGAVNVPPGFIRRVNPVYPEEERRVGAETKVVAEVYIEPSGEVAAVTIVVSGGERFDAAVVAAVEKSLFSPAVMEGKPVRVRVRLPFRFRLR